MADGLINVNPGDVILDSHIETVSSQTVVRFANAAARDAQWPAPPAGAFCYLLDVNMLQVYDNQITGGVNAWHPAGSMRMGYAQVGVGQVIPGGSIDTLLQLTVTAGASNKPGRATWNSDGSVTVPITGVYLVSGAMTWPAVSPASGERRAYIKRYAGGSWIFSGVAGGTVELNTGAVGTTNIRMGPNAMVLCNAGEKLGFFVQHSASASITLGAGEYGGRLGVHFLGGE